MCLTFQNNSIILSRAMIPLLKKLPIIVTLVLFSPVGLAIGCTDIDVKLFNAAQRGNLKKIESLSDQGADINVRLGVDQWTPLMTASREGQLDAALLLLAEGADPNIRDARFNKNAYHWALQYGHRRIAKLLLKRPLQHFQIRLYAHTELLCH